MERNSQSTTFSQREKSKFNIQKLKRRFNTRTQRTFQRKPHYALKRAKHTRHVEARQEPKNQSRPRAHESKQPHKSDGWVTEPPSIKLK
jgi:hypothetical protein